MSRAIRRNPHANLNGSTRPLATLACIALVLAGAAAARAADAISAADIARLRQVESAVISPDGKLVAYVLRVPRAPGKDEDGPAWNELHVVDLSGMSRPFVTGKVSVASVAWTPDGRAISFLAKLNSDKHVALHRIAVDGGEALRVVEHDGDISGYAWSPDGVRVAFLAKEPDAKAVAKRKEKGFKQEIYEEDWKPTQIYIANVDAGAIASAAAVPADKQGASVKSHQRIELAGSVSALRWSPDGARIAAKASKTPLVDDVMMFSRVHVFDVASPSQQSEIETTGKLGDFQFSPDGRHLALIAADDIHDPREGRLVVASASGGATRALLPKYMGHVVDIAWQSPSVVMYVGHERCSAAFGKIDAAGENQKTIVAAGGALVLESISLARDGQSGVFVADAPQHPAEVFAMKHGDAAPRRLTNSNPWLADKRSAKQEVVTYKARDGLELDGILTRPLDERPNTRYPLVLIVHGGPEAHESDGWKTTYHRPAQLLAANGFAVFQPNYRGSTGRGVEFSKLGQHDYAGKEFDDLIDAVDHLVASGLVERSKVGVTGGSYGGYATAWCCTKFSDRFAAGMMAVGLSDNVAAFGATDIPQEMYLVHARVWPWEDWDFYRRTSPIAYAQQARTPLLIVHGKDDPRVHPSQSLSLFRYLKTLGKAPVRLVYYPGEGHGNSKAAARLDYCLRLMQWMEHYLKGPGGAPPAMELDYGIEFGSD